MVLNFGHTIGHAFELAGNYETWTHGQGVAAGMNWAAQIGVGLGVTPDIVYPIQNILKKYGLPIDIPCPWDTLTKAVRLSCAGTLMHAGLRRSVPCAANG